MIVMSGHEREGGRTAVAHLPLLSRARKERGAASLYVLRRERERERSSLFGIPHDSNGKQRIFGTSDKRGKGALQYHQTSSGL